MDTQDSKLYAAWMKTVALKRDLERLDKPGARELREALDNFVALNEKNLVHRLPGGDW